MDYRYFQDPDLPSLFVSDETIAAARAALPELPAAKRARYVAQLGLTVADAEVLTAHPKVAEFFESAVTALVTRTGGKLASETAGKKVANFVQAEVLRFVETDGLAAKLPVSIEQLVDLLALVEAGDISGKQAKGVLTEMITSGKSAAKIVKEQGLVQVSDTGAIESVAREVLAGSPDNVRLYRSGKTNVLGFFVGQVMRAMKGAGNPKLVNDVLKKLLDEAP
jgi:aspartyl-tRNA(Asn)/glutamyl-tRNA(Gln) amidotransferase subunit B